MLFGGRYGKCFGNGFDPVVKHKVKLVGKYLQHKLVQIMPMPAERRSWPYSVVCNSLPKAGTNLLTSAVLRLHSVSKRYCDYQLDARVCNVCKQLGNSRTGHVISAHESYSEGFLEVLGNHQLKHFLIVRDLRDIAVSNVHYLMADKSHRLHGFFRNLPGFRERLLASIEGVEPNMLIGSMRSKSWAEHASGYIPYLSDTRVLVVRFEDLVGEKGGGNFDRQLYALGCMSRHLEIVLGDIELKRIASTLFGNTRTFRRGLIGGWTEEFEDVHIESFLRSGGGTANRALGYSISL